MSFFEWVGIMVAAVVIASALSDVGTGLMDVARALRERGE